jgi:hypothetical protein
MLTVYKDFRKGRGFGFELTKFLVIDPIPCAFAEILLFNKWGRFGLCNYKQAPPGIDLIGLDAYLESDMSLTAIYLAKQVYSGDCFAGFEVAKFTVWTVWL